MMVFCAGFLIPQRVAVQDYFRAARQAFPRALFPPVPVLADVATQAHWLANRIRRDCPEGPLHLVAYRMGGLDARP
jgi:hypothetical protein